MDLKNIRHYKGSCSYFIVGKCRKDTNFDYEDAYCHYDIDVDRISLYKKNDDVYFIKYNVVQKIGIMPLQLKKKNGYETNDYNNGDNNIFIENSDKGFFQTMRKIWNQIIKSININNAPNFVQNTLDDNSEYIEANVLENTNFVKSNCYKDELIIVLHSVINNNLKASLSELRNYEN